MAQSKSMQTLCAACPSEALQVWGLKFQGIYDFLGRGEGWALGLRQLCLVCLRLLGEGLLPSTVGPRLYLEVPRIHSDGFRV